MILKKCKANTTYKISLAFLLIFRADIIVYETDVGVVQDRVIVSDINEQTCKTKRKSLLPVLVYKLVMCKSLAKKLFRYVFIYSLLLRAGCNTRSIFKWSTAGLTSEFQNSRHFFHFIFGPSLSIHKSTTDIYLFSFYKTLSTKIIRLYLIFFNSHFRDIFCLRAEHFDFIKYSFNKCYFPQVIAEREPNGFTDWLVIIFSIILFHLRFCWFFFIVAHLRWKKMLTILIIIIMEAQKDAIRTNYSKAKIDKTQLNRKSRLCWW